MLIEIDERTADAILGAYYAVGNEGEVKLCNPFTTAQSCPNCKTISNAEIRQILLDLYCKYDKEKVQYNQNYLVDEKQTKENIAKYREPFDMWLSIKGAPLAHYEINKICEFVDEFGKQWVLEAMDITGANGKCKLGYTHTILNNWRTDGRETVKPVKKESTIEELLQKWED